MRTTSTSVRPGVLGPLMDRRCSARRVLPSESTATSDSRAWIAGGRASHGPPAGRRRTLMNSAPGAQVMATSPSSLPAMRGSPLTEQNPLVLAARPRKCGAVQLPVEAVNSDATTSG